MAVARDAAVETKFEEAMGLLKSSWKSVRSMAGVIGSVCCKFQEKS